MNVLKWNIIVLIFLGAVIWNGCSQDHPASIDNFEIRVREIVSDSQMKATVLELDIPSTTDSQRTVVSVKHESGRGGGGEGKIWFSNHPEGKAISGEVFLSASQFTLSEMDQAYIQTLIRPRTNARDGAGGPDYWAVPNDTDIDTFFVITATNGVFSLNKPILIAELEGGPVELVVSRTPD